jgi:DNA repair exonuclease SbcCD ATPase subunit
MASESSDTSPLSVTLPVELNAWLDDHAADLGVDRETVVVQLLASYRATAELTDGKAPPDGLEAVVEELIHDRADDIEQEVSAAVDDRLAALEADFMEKIEDVRERVIQVKRETDTKAPADHDHDAVDRLETRVDRLDELAAEIDRLDDVESRLGSLESTVEMLGSAADERDDRLEAAESDLEAAESDLEAAESNLEAVGSDLEAVESDLEDIEEKLRRVAWVVKDLREGHRDGSKRGVTVDGIKRAAAREGISKAACETCGEVVEIGLLTDPECPHCEAPVTDVEPARSFFSKPRLAAATPIEPPDEGE